MRPKHQRSRVGTRGTRPRSRRAWTAGRTKVQITLLLGVTALPLTACSASDAVGRTSSTPSTAPTTKVEAPTTTAAPTTPTPATTPASITTVAPTLAASTAPATTVPAGKPAETAVAEVTARLNEYWAAMDRCFEAPTICDPQTIVAEYADPETPIAKWLTSWVADFAGNGFRVVNSDQIQRELLTPKPDLDGVSVLTTQCISDGAVAVADVLTETSIVDDEVGYYRIDMMWKREGANWMVHGSTIATLDRSGDTQCDFS